MLTFGSIQASVCRNGVNLGSIRIEHNGNSICDLRLLSLLTNEEKREIEKIAKNLTDFLEICSTTEESYYVEKDKEIRGYNVKRRIDKQVATVGIIKEYNKQLYFFNNITDGEIQLCLLQINHQHLTDFYYREVYYNGEN